MKIYSFDVFDTLITRKVATPKGIFALIQKELQSNKKYFDIDIYLRENFYVLRIHAEELARSTYCVGEVEDVTLAQIYEALGMCCGLTAIEQALLVELEVQTECKNIVPIRTNINRVLELAEQKKTVVLISDMYLQTEYVRQMLGSADERLTELPLYVSSDIGKCKWNGKLFLYVKKELQVEGEWIHVGDNLHSDVEMPKQQGIQTECYEYEPLQECELDVLRENETNAEIQLLIGAARNTRLEHGLSGEAAIGNTIGAGILFPYAWWIVQQCLKRGTKRLYFIARDGYIPKLLVDKIIEKLDLNIQTYYIYGSRYTWRNPSLCEQTWDLQNLLRGSYAERMTSVEKLADFFQITVTELLRFLPKYYLKKNIEIGIVEVHYIVKFLQNNSDFQTFLLEKYAPKRDMVIAYLKQEIDVSDDAFSFVDLSGSGYTQGCLANLMQDFYPKRIHTFFFKMDFMHIAKQCDFSVFFPSRMEKELIIEMICRAPHGQTIDYEVCLDTGEIVPVLEAGETQAMLDHGYEAYLNGIELTSKAWIELIWSKAVCCNSLELLYRYFRYLTQRPDDKILEFFGDMPNSLTGREKNIKVFAPKLTKEQIRNIYLHGKYDECYMGSCFEYSLLRCTEEEKELVAYYQNYVNTPEGRAERQNMQPYDPFQRFPFGMLMPKTVIYGAGKRGQLLMERIIEKKQQDNIIWVDKNASNLQDLQEKYSIKIYGLDALKTMEYKLIILAVLRKELADDIKQELVGMGIEPEKIWWIDYSFPYQRARHELIKNSLKD